MTGQRPGRHGVFDFFRMDPETRQIRFFSSQDVGQPTIWSLASAAGLKVTSLNFPSMFPAPRVEGTIVPGWIPWRQFRIACWPEDLFDRLKALPGFNPRELAMDFKLEEKATEGCSNADEYAPWIELHIRRERNWVSILEHIDRENPAELTAILFDGIDKLQHLCWRFIRPQDARPLTEEWEFRARDLCLDYFRELDRVIGELLTLAGTSANVFVASDHGFGPTQTVFYANAWLASRGYLTWASSNLHGATDDGALLGVGKVARHTWMLDWPQTKAFAVTPTSNGIFIPLSKRDGDPGIAPQEYSEFRQRLIEELLEVRHPETGQKVIAEVWTREQIFTGEYSEFGPDLTLVMADGGLLSILPSPVAVGRRPEMAGAHRPVGIFGARGPAIRRAVRANELSILDVAPAVLYTLGVPLPGGMDGRLPEAIFDPIHLHSNAPQYVSENENPSVEHVSVNLTAADEEAVMERLRQLGYIE